MILELQKEGASNLLMNLDRVRFMLDDHVFDATRDTRESIITISTHV